MALPAGGALAVGGLLVPRYGLPALAAGFGIASLLGIPLLLLGFRLPPGHEQAASTAAGAARSESSLGRFWNRVVLSGFCIALLIQGVLAATLSALIEHYYGARIDLFGLLLSVTALSG